MITIRRTVGSLLAVLTLLVAASPAPAGERTHTVSRGESVSSIAKRYYGDYELAGLLLELNGRSGTTIRPGETLRVPYCEIHGVRAGDSWSTLAQRYLARSSAYPAVAALNGLAPDEPLRVGQTLVMPVLLTHRLRSGESLSKIADRYYGDAGLGALLQEFNRIGDPRRLSVGETIEIPLISLRLADAESTPPPASAKAVEAPPEPLPEDGSRYDDELRSAASKYRRGDYELARRALESLRADVQRNGTPTDRLELGRLLAFVYVAFDRSDEACAAYALTGVSPDALDADRISPKIRRTLSRCPDSGT